MALHSVENLQRKKRSALHKIQASVVDVLNTTIVKIFLLNLGIA